MTAQPDHPSAPPAPPLRTLGDIRAALQHGYGFPGDPTHGILSDRELFEEDLRRALAGATEADFTAVGKVLSDYRGRILTRLDPGFEAAIAEGIAHARAMKEQHR